MDPALRELFAHAPPEREAEIVLRLAEGAPAPSGLRVVSRFGTVLTARTQVGRIPEIRSSPLVRSVKAPRALRGERPRDRILDRRPEHRRRPEVPEAGRGVVIGVIDWGCDFAHPNIRREDGRTRLVRLWDQRSRDGAPVTPYGYGVVHDRADIDDALTRRDPYAALGYHPAVGRDRDGAHGTHVLDICAGSGHAPGAETGLAPEADLVFVHLDAGDGQGLGTLGDSVRVLEAIDFVARSSGGRPWVVNLSLGSMGGPHDGTTLLEQGMDAMLERAPGAAIVCSVGNYFGSGTHASFGVPPGGTAELAWIIEGGDPTTNELEVWYSSRDVLDLELLAPNGQRTRAALGESADVSMDGTVIGRVHHRAFDPNNRDHHVDIFLYDQAPPGHWRLVLHGVDVRHGDAHAWIERDPGGTTRQSRFEAVDQDARSTLGTICNGRWPICVGAYEQDGHRPLASFSSAGPTRDGRPKPDLIAPGVDVVAARSAARDDADQDQPLVAKSGASMAAPHVTGTIALMFEAAARPLAIEETRDLLLTSTQAARRLPAMRAGAGYLDSRHAVEAARRAVPHPAREARVHETVRQPKGAKMYATMESYNGAGHGEPELSTVAAAELFDEIVFEEDDRGRPRREAFEVVAMPRETLMEDLRPGDLLVERAVGEGRVARVSEVADAELLTPASFGPTERALGHVLVIPPSGLGEASRVHRLTDETGRVLHDRMILRPRGVPGWSEAAESAAKIPRDSINFVSLEGGGGKGVLYPAALEALEERGVLQYRSDSGGLRAPNQGGQIKGISGASAGAMTALMLVAGYRPGKIKRIVEEKNFTTFFDDPDPGAPYVISRHTSPPKPRSSALFSLDRMVRSLMSATMAGTAGTAVRELLSHVLEPPLDRLVDPALTELYYESFMRDFGLFSGWKARTFLAEQLRDGLQNFYGASSAANVDFQTLVEITGIELAVSGTNLVTQKSEVFSSRTTPMFPVVDAVRISMGFPFVFKPAHVRGPVASGVARTGVGMSPENMEGVWIDGGALNNLPMRFLDPDAQHSLGLRLGSEKPEPITHIFKYVFRVLETMFSSSEGHVSESLGTGPRSITLPTRFGRDEIGVMDFDPDKDLVNTLSQRGKRLVLDRVT